VGTYTPGVHGEETSRRAEMNFKCRGRSGSLQFEEEKKGDNKIEGQPKWKRQINGTGGNQREEGKRA